MSISETNNIHKNLIAAFGTISGKNGATDKLCYTKKQIYNWIHAGEVSQSARKKIRAMGYCPDTFKEL